MLTIMIHATIKQDKLDDYIELIRMLSQKAGKKGCLFYRFNQNREDPFNFVLYEQWESQEALDVHMQELFALLGPCRPGSPIPDKLMDMYESVTPVFYDVIE
ncbi:MAG: antibiotic biosynthesis monooxygenase [Gammaproteobacteria bacterium]|nr:antibiotic biosynthesis monooxygenase [Gammaproteobacteria bacterium]MDH5800898.1 antibiotic biosynthesis monooxygenase [Gammaproteobacteria bacterium]